MVMDDLITLLFTRMPPHVNNEQAVCDMSKLVAGATKDQEL